MRKVHLLIAIAFLAQIVAWFLPVVKEGVTFPHGLPGWQAFRVAACAVWPYEGFTIDRCYNVILSTISAATTLLFLLGAGWIVAIGSARLRRLSAWIAASAFVVNAYWILGFGSDRSALRIGYFLWCFSFLLLAIGLYRLSHAKVSQ